MELIMDEMDKILKYRAENAMMISAKKYEMSLSFSDITTFEYDVQSKKIIIEEKDYKDFGMPTIMENGVEEVLTYGAIAKRSYDKLRWVYRQMDEGKPSAKCIVYANTLVGDEHIFEIRLVNIFDSNHKPVYAVGIRKDITEISLLKRDKEFGETMASDQIFLYDVNINTNEILSYNAKWAEAYGIVGVTSFTELKNAIKERFIEPEFWDELTEKLSKKYIINAFNNGQRRISIEYRKKTIDDKYYWFRKKVHIIRDEDSGDIFIRCYILNIDEKKKKEMKALEEQKRYEGLVAKSIAAYSLNITKDKILFGHEKWDEQFKIPKSDSYTNMMYYVLKVIVHPEDRDRVGAMFSRENLLHEYYEAEHEISCDYRRKASESSYIWVRTDIHLYEDPQSGDIKAFFYVENIDEEKTAALEMQYRAEHDLLTGLYNKSSMEKYVDEFLQSDIGTIGRHAFLMIDVDYFKSVNDNFGHAFGDAVLSQIGQKLKELFRDVDIIGRIGGDEFVVFMKNVSRSKVAFAKAQEICDKISDTFKKNDIEHKITASIGISFFKEDGETYAELYRHADTALYVSKEKNRNRFTVYSSDMIDMDTCMNEIDVTEHIEQRNFEENTTECVFRILYESDDKNSAINAVLGLIGKHYNVSRSYVFENSYDDTYMTNTFEWCNDGISPQIENLKMVPYAAVGDYKQNFNANGIFYMSDISKVSENLRAILEPQDIKNMIQFSIIKDGKFKGYIGFDECNKDECANKQVVSELQSISNILGVFVAQMRYADEVDESRRVTLSIINGLDSYAYVCDPKTHKILFGNRNSMNITPNLKIGSVCYEIIAGRTEPCERCPMQIIIDKGLKKYSLEIKNDFLGIWEGATASWIEWHGGEAKCLVDITDITKYRRGNDCGK
ncbi:MAG: sensor domain-containing diguanylate cyclase [Hydrogenoanaerobacterium sp.]